MRPDRAGPGTSSDWLRPRDVKGFTTGDPPVTGTNDRVEDRVDELLDDLRDRLVATAERPVDREANRWLGEAESVVADVAGGEVAEETVRKRIEQARDLLEHVDETGDREADEHVEAARDLAERILERV